MKHLFLFSLLVALFASCTEKETPDVAIINGKVFSTDAKEIKFSWMVDNPITGDGNSFTAEIKSDSTFSIEIPVKNIAKGRINNGRFYHEISLLPGDNFYTEMDGDTIKYKGKGAGKNNFLYQSELNGTSDGAYYREANAGKLSPKDFVIAMQKFKQKRFDLLDQSVKKLDLDKRFVDWYKIETEVVFEDLLSEYPRRYAYYNKIHPDSIEMPEECIRLKSFTNIIDDKKTVSATYIHNIGNQIYNKSQELMKKDTTVQWKDAMYTILFDSLSGKSREYLVAYYICSAFSNDTYDTIAIKYFENMEKDELASVTYDAAYKKFNEKRALIGQTLHPEFAQTMLLDTAGNEILFGKVMEKLKGNVVYFDLWSMGCGPCRAAMPYAKKLKEKLKAEPIKFLYVSADQVSGNNWEQVYKMTSTKDNHYTMKNRFDARMLKFMGINWVPNYMIFDKEGKLVNFNADRPSNMIENTETKLERTLKKLAEKQL